MIYIQPVNSIKEKAKRAEIYLYKRLMSKKQNKTMQKL